MEALQDLRAKIERCYDFGAQCFGEQWAGQQSDWQTLQSAAAWLSSRKGLRLVAAELAGLPERGASLTRAHGLITARQKWLASFSVLVEDMMIGVSSNKPDAVVSRGDLRSAHAVPVKDLAERMKQWLEHPEALSKWMAFRECESRIEGLSLSPLTERLLDGRILAAGAGHAFVLAYHECLLKEMLRECPTLSHFDGSAHSRAVDRFVAPERNREAVAPPAHPATDAEGRTGCAGSQACHDDESVICRSVPAPRQADFRSARDGRS